MSRNIKEPNCAFLVGGDYLSNILYKKILEKSWNTLFIKKDYLKTIGSVWSVKTIYFFPSTYDNGSIIKL